MSLANLYYILMRVVSENVLVDQDTPRLVQVAEVSIALELTVLQLHWVKMCFPPDLVCRNTWLFPRWVCLT